MNEYTTVIENHSPNVWRFRSPQNYTGEYFSFRPGTVSTVEFDDGYFLCPFSKIIYRKNGKIDVVKRKGYEAPVLQFPFVRFLNKGGNNIEIIILDIASKIELPKGIERTVEVAVDSIYAESESVTIDEPLKIPVPDFHIGGMRTILKPNIIYTPRSKEQMEKLKKLRMKKFFKSSGFPDII